MSERLMESNKNTKYGSIQTQSQEEDEEAEYEPPSSILGLEEREARITTNSKNEKDLHHNTKSTPSTMKLQSSENESADFGSFGASSSHKQIHKKSPRKKTMRSDGNQPSHSCLVLFFSQLRFVSLVALCVFCVAELCSMPHSSQNQVQPPQNPSRTQHDFFFTHWISVLVRIYILILTAYCILIEWISNIQNTSGRTNSDRSYNARDSPRKRMRWFCCCWCCCRSICSCCTQDKCNNTTWIHVFRLPEEHWWIRGFLFSFLGGIGFELSRSLTPYSSVDNSHDTSTMQVSDSSENNRIQQGWNYFSSFVANYHTTLSNRILFWSLRISSLLICLCGLIYFLSGILCLRQYIIHQEETRLRRRRQQQEEEEDELDDHDLFMYEDSLL